MALISPINLDGSFSFVDVSRHRHDQPPTAKDDTQRSHIGILGKRSQAQRCSLCGVIGFLYDV